MHVVIHANYHRRKKCIPRHAERIYRLKVTSKEQEMLFYIMPVQLGWYVHAKDPGLFPHQLYFSYKKQSGINIHNT